MSRRLRVAAAQFPVSEPQNWAAAADQLGRWVKDAANARAQLLVFPEYASMSLAALFAAPIRADLRQQLQTMQTLCDDYLAVHRELARRYSVYLLAGSFPWQLGNSLFHNRAWLFAPDGTADFQDKRIMTRFEREQWGIFGGAEVPLKVFDTEVGRLAVNICYDVEFPLLAHAQVEAGAQLILVPSCTDTVAGYHRVRIGAQARALENQCIVVQSPLVGSARWSPAVDINIGAASVYAPPDRGFPDNGVIASGPMNTPCWIYADVDLDHIDDVRRNGQVLNARDWPEQQSLRCVVKQL